MKRLLRILATSLLALSLLISITSLLAWHHSLFYWDFASLRAGRTTIMVNTYPDAMLLTIGHRTDGLPDEWRVGHYPQRHPNDRVVNRDYRWGMRWFGLERSRWTEGRLTTNGLNYSGFRFAASFWSIALITFLPPALFLSLRVRRLIKHRSRRRRGLCPICGYDLRASPTGCPECGAAAHTNPGNNPLLPTPH